MSDANTRSRSPLRRLALLLAAALTLGAATMALAQPPGYRGGGNHGIASRIFVPRMPAPRMGPQRMPAPGMRRPAAQYPWAGTVAGPGGRGYTRPLRTYGPPGSGYAPPAPSWSQPRPVGRWGGYPAEPGPTAYAAPAGAARAWRRGGYLPPAYSGVVVQDFGRYHLRRPPNGYNWVRQGSEFLLVSSGTGLIFDVVPAY